VWLDLTALRDDRTSATCVAVAEVLHTVSHDRLTRMLQADWAGQRLLESAVRTLCVWDRGYLSIDDTVVPTPVATVMAGVAGGFASPQGTAGDGFSVVVRSWTAGRVRMPLGRRLWPQGGPSPLELALEVLSSARHRLHCRPASGRVGAWAPATALRKRLRDDGWYMGWRLQQTRRCNGQPLRADRRHPSGAESGWRSGGLQVVVGRDGAKSDAPNRLTLPAAEGRRLSRMRAHSAEVLRGCTDQRGWHGGHARAERAQRQHLTCCLVACCVLERDRQDRPLTLDNLQRHLSCHGRKVGLPALERLRQAA